MNRYVPSPVIASTISHCRALARPPQQVRRLHVDQPSQRPTLRLCPRTKAEKGGDARLARLVPWIFRNEVANMEDLRKLGEPAVLANVENSEGRELGVALCNLQKGSEVSNVNIVGRMVTDNIHLTVDRNLLATRIRRSLRHREALSSAAAKSIGASSVPFYRLLNGEGDQIPGVLCDRYGDKLVLHFTAFAAEKLLLEPLLDALEEVLKPSAIVIRGDMLGSRGIDRMLDLLQGCIPRVARGSFEGPVVFPDESGLVFEANLLDESFESGRFFEDRPLRALLREFSHEFGLQVASGEGGLDVPQNKEPPRVLSLFGESLGLALAAKGAQLTMLINGDLGDVGQQERASSVASRNGCAERLQILSPIGISADDKITQQAEAALKQHASEGMGTYHVVTLETPPLAPSYSKVEEGLQRYTAWVALAAGATRPGGILLIVCRSRTLTVAQFLRFVNLGLWAAKRHGAIIHRGAAAPFDFPMSLGLPHTREMQSIALRLH